MTRLHLLFLQKVCYREYVELSVTTIGFYLLRMFMCPCVIRLLRILVFLGALVLPLVLLPTLMMLHVHASVPYMSSCLICFMCTQGFGALRVLLT